MFKKEYFRYLIILQILLSFLLLWKSYNYPLSFASDEFKNLIFNFWSDEPDNLSNFDLYGLYFILFLALIAYVLLFNFKKIGRQIFTLLFLISFPLIFIDTYYVYDVLDAFFFDLSTVIDGFILSIIYFSNLSKEFK